jgi:hypothetical protein
MMANNRKHGKRYAFPDFIGPGGLVLSRVCELHTLHKIRPMDFDDDSKDSQEE